MATPPNPWTGPGIILGFFSQRPTSQTTPDILEKWFAEEFVPSLLATGAVESAALYKAADANYNKQNLLVYKVKDLAIVQAGALQKIPRTSRSGLFEGTVDEHTELETRVYSSVQEYQVKDGSKGPEPTIMLAMMQPPPGGEAELDKWYRDEHNEQMSKEPGYLRTLRYSLLMQFTNGGEKSQELSFLAIHAFGEDNSLGTEVKPLQPMTDWTKKVMGESKGIDAAIYKMVRVFGE